MKESVIKENIIVLFLGVFFSAILMILSNKFLNGMAVKFLGICAISYLMAFLVGKTVLLTYLLLSSAILIFLNGYKLESSIDYLPFVIEAFVGSYLISFIKNIFYNNELLSSFFAVIIGRISFFTTGFILYDVILKKVIFNEFLISHLSNEVVGMIFCVIFVPFICYSIKKNTIMWN